MNKSLNDRLVKVLMLKLIPRVPCIVIKRNNRALLFPGTCSPMTVKISPDAFLLGRPFVDDRNFKLF